jgi:glycosyltransferase involved in cell wall biosynthesis
MRVLWFTNIIMPELDEKLGRKTQVTGGWMPALLDVLRGEEGIELAVATRVRGCHPSSGYSIKGVTYFCLPGAKGRTHKAATDLAEPCRRVISAFAPDVIHLHGTEDMYGLAVNADSGERPVVVSIQGLIHVCKEHVGGGIGLRTALAAGHHGFLVWLRYLLQEREWANRGRVEQHIIRTHQSFIGRTAWDRAHVRAVNATAQYFHCWELLRAPFFAAEWSQDSRKPHTIFCTSALSPLKGFHVLLSSAAMLRGEFPNLEIRVAGAPWNAKSGKGYYGRYIRAQIDRLGLSSNVTALPALGPADVANELVRAHAFVLPSFMENSPNSLAEAMLVGTPSITSFVGGVPSMVSDGETALAFPSGDAAYLAHNLRRIFADDLLARSLSSASRAVAQGRHGAGTVCATQMAIYRDLIGTGRSHA